MDKTVIVENYEFRLDSPLVEDFSQLRSKVGWGVIDSNLAKVSLNNSLFHVSVYDKSQLIGMGRVVGDGAMYFYIQDVIIDPNYQNLGIGSALMNEIEGYLAKVAVKGATIGLLAAQGKEAFYAKYGYIKRPNESLGNGMCKFI